MVKSVTILVSLKLIIDGEYLRFDNDLSEACAMTVLVHRGEDNKAFLVGLDEAVEGVEFILVELNLLTDSLAVEDHRWIADKHLEGDLSQSFYEVYDTKVNVWSLI